MRMAWIEVHQSLPTHHKLKKLARALGLKKNGIAEAVGHMCMLWLWSIDNAPDGQLSGIDAGDIAEAAGWGGDANKLVEAMTCAGFIVDGAIHDWDDYIGRLNDRRADNARRNREARARKKKERDAQNDVSLPSRAHHDTITRASRDGATVPNRTQPYLTVPNQTKPNQTVDADASTAREGFSGGDPLDAYLSNNLTIMSPGNYAELREMMQDGMTDEIVRYAVDIATADNKRSWGFVRYLLNQWIIAGLKNVGEVKDYEAKRKEGMKRGAGGRDAGHREDHGASQGPHIDDAELERFEREYYSGKQVP
jgi:DnaD/phage-associated family protein